ncbi:MAG: hypothetical protein M1838_006279 [Thelocarpon superellum]|nr:MAG: hypothetical protein M1838_006279 [Thelocarpon superellum]
MASARSGQHLAAILRSKGSHLDVTHRPTPTPGPNEILVAPRSIAINPIDYFQRETGYVIDTYPTVVGSDIGGTVVSTGPSVPAEMFKPGTRIAAFAPCFFKRGDPDYGAFQARVLVPSVSAVPIPEGMSFTEASLLPMAIVTAWAGLYSIGVPLDPAYTAADKKGILVWGGSSSVGSTTVQVARLLGYHVYATASEKHHAYIEELGAHRTFDYKRDDVVASIVQAAKEDGVALQTGYNAVGALRQCLDVLKEFKGSSSAGSLKIASATRIPDPAPVEEGIEVKFVSSPKDADERADFSRFVFHTWLQGKLASREFVPSPKIQLVDGGLEGLNNALDLWKKGVSGTKLVVEVD